MQGEVGSHAIKDLFSRCATECKAGSCTTIASKIGQDHSFIDPSISSAYSYRPGHPFKNYALLEQFGPEDRLDFFLEVSSMSKWCCPLRANYPKVPEVVVMLATGRKFLILKT